MGFRDNSLIIGKMLKKLKSSCYLKRLIRQTSIRCICYCIVTESMLFLCPFQKACISVHPEHLQIVRVPVATAASKIDYLLTFLVVTFYQRV